jgi:hypothetical protein
VPLNPKYEVPPIRVLRALDRLNHSILRAACRNPQTISWNANRLMMRRIDSKSPKIAGERSFNGIYHLTHQ